MIFLLFLLLDKDCSFSAFLERKKKSFFDWSDFGNPLFPRIFTSKAHAKRLNIKRNWDHHKSVVKEVKVLLHFSPKLVITKFPELLSKKIFIFVFWLLQQNYWESSKPCEQKLKKRTQLTCCQTLVPSKWPGGSVEAVS